MKKQKKRSPQQAPGPAGYIPPAFASSRAQPSEPETPAQPAAGRPDLTSGVAGIYGLQPPSRLSVGVMRRVGEPIPEDPSQRPTLRPRAIDLARGIRSMKKGGKVTKTGPYKLHKGEVVVPAKAKRPKPPVRGPKPRPRPAATTKAPARGISAGVAPIVGFRPPEWLPDLGRY